MRLVSPFLACMYVCTLDLLLAHYLAIIHHSMFCIWIWAHIAIHDADAANGEIYGARDLHCGMFPQKESCNLCTKYG